jgi:hypothetical protein
MTPNDTTITPNPLQPNGYGGVESDSDIRVPFHTHDGVNSPKLVYDNALTDTPTIEASNPKTATFVIGPSSNSDSDTYDYVTDGTADDVQIQAAVDALPTNGGSILLREGTYTLAAVVTIAHNGVQILGCGKGTRITNSGTNYSYFKLGHASTQYSGAVLRDIYFTSAQSTNVPIIDNVILAKPMENVIIEDCEFTTMSATDSVIGLGFSGAGNQHLIFGNTFYNWGSGYAIEIGSTTTGKIFISNNRFETTSTTVKVLYDGVHIARADNNIFILPASYNTTVVEGMGNFSNNRITVGATAGASCKALFNCYTVSDNYINAELGAGSFANVSSVACQACVVVSGNYILGFGKAVYYISGDGGSGTGTITGNILHGVGHIIEVNATSQVVIVGNKIDCGTKSANDTYSGVFLQQVATNNVISGNHFAEGSGSKVKYGIRENTTNDDANLITSNIVKGGVTTKISTQGSNTDVSHNITT